MTNGKPAAPICRDCFLKVVDTLRNLTLASNSVVNNWESGDLAGAVHLLDTENEAAKNMLRDIYQSLGGGSGHAHH